MCQPPACATGPATAATAAVSRLRVLRRLANTAQRNTAHATPGAPAIRRARSRAGRERLPGTGAPGGAGGRGRALAEAAHELPAVAHDGAHVQHGLHGARVAHGDLGHPLHARHVAPQAVGRLQRAAAHGAQAALRRRRALLLRAHITGVGRSLPLLRVQPTLPAHARHTAACSWAAARACPPSRATRASLQCRTRAHAPARPHESRSQVLAAVNSNKEQSGPGCLPGPHYEAMKLRVKGARGAP